MDTPNGHQAPQPDVDATLLAVRVEAEAMRPGPARAALLSAAATLMADASIARCRGSYLVDLTDATEALIGRYTAVAA